jgi:hypothetical protein
VAGMDEVLMWPGRMYPAGVMLVVGLWLVVSGLRAALRERQPKGWPEWALVYLFAFRRVVVGMCLVAAGVALASQLSWLLAASVCIGLGELLESSYYIGVLRWGQRRGSIPSPGT